MLDRRERALRVERRALVGNDQEQNAAGTQLPEVLLDRPDWVLTMLDEVAGCDEVERPVIERTKHLAVVDDIGFYEWKLSELWVLRTQLGHRETVDVANVCVDRNGQLAVQRSDLDAVAVKVPKGRQGPWIGYCADSEMHDRTSNASLCRASDVVKTKHTRTVSRTGRHTCVLTPEQADRSPKAAAARGTPAQTGRRLGGLRASAR